MIMVEHWLKSHYEFYQTSMASSQALASLLMGETFKSWKAFWLKIMFESRLKFHRGFYPTLIVISSALVTDMALYP